jgi:hypothetical protein
MPRAALARDGRAGDIGQGCVRPFRPVAGWFFACVVVWWFAFPAYLVMRPRYVARKRQASLPRSGGTVADELWRLAGLRNSGVLTQAE